MNLSELLAALLLLALIFAVLPLRPGVHRLPRPAGPRPRPAPPPPLSPHVMPAERRLEAVLDVRNHGEDEIKRSVRITRQHAERFLEETKWAE